MAMAARSPASDHRGGLARRATVVLIGGVWALFTYVHPAGDHADEQTPTVEAHQGVAVGRDLNTGGGGISIGTSSPTLPSKPSAAGQ